MCVKPAMMVTNPVQSAIDDVWAAPIYKRLYQTGQLPATYERKKSYRTTLLQRRIVSGL